MAEFVPEFVPTPSQKRLFEAFGAFLESPNDILIVNGYAGCGKTTAISKIIQFLPSTGHRSVLLAPTGRSAKVFSHYSGRKAYTIHKYIYRTLPSGGFAPLKNRLEDTVFFVDEASLVGFGDDSRNLLEDLVNYVREGSDCRLVLIGDDAQLPPVGMTASPALDLDYMSATFGRIAAYISMTEVVRQGLDSGILAEATKVREQIFSMEEDPADVARSLEAHEDVVKINGSELIDALSAAYAEFGEDEVTVLAHSNKRALRYNLGIRNMVKYYEERLCKGEPLMIVKNNYLFSKDEPNIPFIANGDIAYLGKINHFETRYGLEFADATLTFPDYDTAQLRGVKVCLDALLSESPALSREQSNALFEGVKADFAHLSPKEQYDAMKADPYLNALQLKYASAITAHKSQGGGWDCVFIDYPSYAFEDPTFDALKWLYTTLTRAKKKVYLVNFPQR